MRKVLAAAFVVLMLVATGCSTKKDTTTTPTTSETQETSNKFTVGVDGKSDKFNMFAYSFFPKELSVHPGDTVDFKEVFTGEPHTVALGTAVDAAIVAYNTLTPEQKQSDGPPPADVKKVFDKLPNVFPEGDVQGPPKLNQSAAQACFIDTGDAPVSDKGDAPACPKREQPEFNGTQTLFNSGYLAEDENFAVKFDKNIKPGAYNVMCLVHGTEMSAKITVAEKATKVATPDEVTANGKKELDTLVSALAPLYDKAKTDSTPAKAVAGLGAQEVMGAAIAEFLPKEISVPVGETVSWTTFHFHSISFNAPQDQIGGALSKAADGTVSLAKAAGEPTKDAPAIPPEVGGGSAKKPTTISATYDGSGFFSSSVFGSFPPAQVTYKVKFTKAGTYNLQCLVHPDMKGKVTVG